MLLIITHKTDFTADFIINKLNNRNLAYKRFNCEDVLNYELEFRFTPSLSYKLFGEDQFHSVWFRRTQLPELNHSQVSERLYLLNEIDSFISNMFSVIDARWISDPFAVYKAENKLFQLKMAATIGFNIPKTIITTSKDKLKYFASSVERSLVIKPLSETRIDQDNCLGFLFTNRIPEKYIAALDEFDLTPAIIQEEIVKRKEFRITVVGDKAFSASVDSQSDPETTTDWRKKKLRFMASPIPNNIETLCIQIVKGLGLAFGAIDLIEDVDGNFIFLEINPNGQWAWIETDTGLPISDALIDLFYEFER